MLRSGSVAALLLMVAVGPVSGNSQPRVLVVTVSDLDDDHLDFLTGWDARNEAILDPGDLGATRYRLAPLVAGLVAPAPRMRRFERRVARRVGSRMGAQPGIARERVPREAGVRPRGPGSRRPALSRRPPARVRIPRKPLR